MARCLTEWDVSDEEEEEENTSDPLDQIQEMSENESEDEDEQVDLMDATPSTSTTDQPSSATVQATNTGTRLSVFDQLTGPTITLPQSSNATDFFELFITDDIIDHIVAQSNLYATSNPCSPGYRMDESITPDMVRSFLGVIIAMSWRKFSSTDDYWSTHPILGCPPITNGWTKRRFWAFLHCLHLNNNSTALPREDPNYDKLHKVRPIIEAVRLNCLSNFNPSRDNAIDEAMVAYKGRSSLKQYCPLKPIKRGYKVWCRSDCKTGYMCDFNVYTGKDDGGRCHGLGAKVVKKLSEPIKGKGHVVIFDNFFSSISLLEDLFTDDIGCVATTRSDRREFPSELKQLDLQQGEFKSKICNNVQVIVWKDKKNVKFLNTFCNPLGDTFVKRKQKNGSSCDVSCPEAVAFYNQKMGGVDKHDQRRRHCTISRKSQKWWPRLFYFCIDVALVNAHILETLSPNHVKRTLKQFCMEIAMHYLTRYHCRKRPGRPCRLSPSDLEHSYHWPSDRRDTRRRCANCAESGVEKRTWYECTSCNVGLCPECFETYHT